MNTARTHFLAGFRGGLPFLLVLIPFSLLFGVLAVETGLDLGQTMAMSALVIAGASQFTALQLIADNAPLLVALVTALAVNLRMAMYSASLAAHLGHAPLWQRALVAYTLVDQTYGASITYFQDRPGLGLRDKLAFYSGAVLAVCPAWYVFTFVGAVAGTAIPEALALDFAVPVTFLALVAPQLKSLAHVTAALVSVVLALALAWMPFGLGLLVAAGCAMLAGAAVETWGPGRPRQEARP
ncbi:branched-chain amino acid ABC transporter permease [Rhodobacteraceae bacterium 2CG4]|uniref:Branched-chain amino acid ABC transporter permease n=1 Tax=Halovulum marinum TaxID=2662447 RepID=A0A6L5YV78_9RHOB|nr:AzlC family ABC transporter permease [Halovulum marinum]MSU88201.1 branched-chain amino acid ABC transporter permease [Halovulum marinum]